MSEPDARIHKWPFVASPGAVTNRVIAAYGEFGTMLAALRCVFIEEGEPLVATAKIAALEAEVAQLDQALTQCRALLKQECEDVAPLRAERDALQAVIDRAAAVMHGDGVMDQGQSWDECVRLLDAARSQEGTT
jgi:hypothetical protein